MCAMVFGAMAPTVAQAMVATSEKGQWIEVCSASGMVWLKTDGTTFAAAVVPDQEKPMTDMGKHCPWCSFHGSPAGLPPASLPGPTLISSTHAASGLGSVALTSKVLCCAQARAPPFVS